MNPIQTLTSLGQSLWFDNIHRRLLESGELAAMIARGQIRGVTSNPAIFHNAIAKTGDYDTALVPLAWAGWQAEAIFWQLAMEDIQRTCDLFLPLFRDTHGVDGFVSLEVHPGLAHETEETLAQAQQLWKTVDRPNLMIKIPATREGLPAIRAAIAGGININVTLIFSIERYREVMEAYLSGLEIRLAEQQQKEGQERVSFPASVASFFISRMDTKVDARLPLGSPLRGKAAIANARLAYAAFRETFQGPRWERLRAAGACLQRPLWASTSTKNPEYPDTLYVDNLIAADTVNTVPPQTLEAFRQHGKPALTLNTDIVECKAVFAALEAQGIHMTAVTSELEQEGVLAFAQAFDQMLAAIEKRRQEALAGLGGLAAAVQGRIADLEAEAFTARLWKGDPALWTNDPAKAKEVSQRLGWLRLPETSRSRLEEINRVAGEVHRAGIRKMLLLGMGGSSLAAEVMASVLPLLADLESAEPRQGAPGQVSFTILDSTDPAQVAQAAHDFPPAESLYLVSSKSGGTVEVAAMLEYFWKLSEADGTRFVAITDPGTSLASLARERGFRALLLADATVGGRFSLLTEFGLLPMALMGLAPADLLNSAAVMMRACQADRPTAANPGVMLGAVLAEAALAGRDKLTFLADPPLAAAGWWLEQLITESTGKDCRGIVVIEGEEQSSASAYGNDRCFVYLKTTGGKEALIEALRQACHPVLEFSIPDPHALVAEFYRWQVATATACHILGVNAFDQPDVQDNKDRTRQKLDAFLRQKHLPDPYPGRQVDGLTVFTALNLPCDSLRALLTGFVGLASERDYIALNAYLPRNPKTLAVLKRLRKLIGSQTKCATSLNFGPRFLHSTGQLHKGGPESALFLQITADADLDLDIPGWGYGFGTLERAQALGDYEALQARGRRIVRLHLPSVNAVSLLVDALDGTNG